MDCQPKNDLSGMGVSSTTQVDSIRLDLADPNEVVRCIFDNFQHPFFTVDTNLTVTYMNRLMEALTGYTSDQVVHRMTCDKLLSTHHCCTQRCLLRRVMENGQPVTAFESIVVDRQGRSIPVMIDASVITARDGRIIGGFEALRDISAIMEAEQKIELLAEMTREGTIMVNGEHRVVFANSRVAEFIGHPREKLIGARMEDVLPAQHQKMIVDLMEKAGGNEARRVSFCSLMETGEDAQQVCRVLETSITAARIGGGAVACLCFTDLTDRIEMERQLLHANSFLQNIIHSSVDGIVVLDMKGNVLIFNEGAERILGYQANEVIDHPEVFHRLYNPEVARKNMRLMRSEHHGPPGKLSTTRIVLLDKAGKKIPVNFSAAIIEEGGKEIGTVGIFSDLREHVRIRQELEQTKIQLLQAEKIASLGRMAAGVAHEINNPLAGILIYADMLVREVEEHPQWKADLEEIINQTLRCKTIVTGLLEFSRQPLGQRVQFDINELVNRSAVLLGHQPLFHDITLVQDTQNTIPPILGDPGQIQQVLINLIVNAAGAMNGRGQVTIITRLDAPCEEVVLQVLDTGPGIQEEIIDKIFEPFFTTKKPGEGTGLGLSVVYGIVQQHGGRLEANNRPEGGASFTVWLPLEAPRDLLV